MDDNEDIKKIKELVGNAHNVLLVTHEKPTYDSIGATLALYLALKILKKNPIVSCPDETTVEFSGFVGIDKVSKDLVKNNFIITLDYKEGSIEKVSYNIEGDKFNLVIEPRTGFEPFSEKNVHYTRGSSNVDLIITIDTINLTSLKHLYDNDQSFFSSKTLINIDKHPNNLRYGTLNLIDPNISSTCELVAKVIFNLGITLNEDIATNLLNGLYRATGNFQSRNVTDRTFGLAATCMKYGGKKFRADPESQNQVKPQEQQKTGDRNSDEQEELSKNSISGSKEPSANEPFKKTDENQVRAPQEAPADWLKPKIFKSSNNN